MRLPRVRFTVRRIMIAAGLNAVVLTGVLGHSMEPPQDTSGGGNAKAISGDDHKILVVVLLDLLDFKDFDPLDHGGKKTRIVISDKTAGSSGLLSDDQLDGESHDKMPHLIAHALREDLRKRNAKEPVPLARFVPARPDILVRDLSGLKRGYARAKDFEERYPDAKGYVVAWLPGYSKDGQTAVLRLRFGPTPHGATATYLLVKKDGRWTVVWRKVAHYR